jgi:hypothetical protein
LEPGIVAPAKGAGPGIVFSGANPVPHHEGIAPQMQLGGGLLRQGSSSAALWLRQTPACLPSSGQ